MNNDIAQLKAMMNMFQFVDQEKIPEEEREQLKYLMPLMDVITSSIKPDGDIDMDIMIELVRKYFVLRSEVDTQGFDSSQRLVNIIAGIRDACNTVLD